MHEYNIQSGRLLLEHAVGLCDNGMSASTGRFHNFVCDPDAMVLAHLEIIFGL